MVPFRAVSLPQALAHEAEGKQQGDADSDQHQGNREIRGVEFVWVIDAGAEHTRGGGVDIRKAFVLGTCLLVGSANLEMRAGHTVAAVAVDLVGLLVGNPNGNSAFTATESNTVYMQNENVSGIITLGTLKLKDDSGVLKVSDDGGTTWKTVTLS